MDVTAISQRMNFQINSGDDRDESKHLIGPATSILEAHASALIDCPEGDGFVSFLLEHGPRLIARGEASLIHRWLEALPVEQRESNAWLDYWEGAAMFAAQPTAARARLERVWSCFGERSDRLGQAFTAATLLSAHQAGMGSAASLQSWLERLEQSMREVGSELPPSLEAFLTSPLVIALVLAKPMSATLPLYLTRLTQLLDADLELCHGLSAVRALLIAQAWALAAGSNDAPVAWLRTALEEDELPPSMRLASLNSLAYGLCLEGAYEESRELIAGSNTYASRHRLEQSDPFYFMAWHRVALARHDLTEIDECAQSLRARLKGGQDLGQMLLSQMLAVQASLRQDRATAMRHWEALLARADAGAVLPLRWMARLGLAACCSAEEPTRASAHLDEALELFERTPPEAWRTDHALIVAYVALSREDRAECHRTLRSLPATAPLSASIVCAALPTVAATLCLEAMRSQVATELARSLVERYRLPPPLNADAHWPWPFRIYVLGTFKILKANIPLRTSRRLQRRTLELFQALIAFGGQEVSAGVLTDALWPDSDGDAGYHALESTLYRLRQLLGSPAAVVMSGGKLTLDRSYFWVDLWALEQVLPPGSTSSVDAPQRLARIRSLYAGHFLANECDKSWAIEKRQAVRGKLLRAIREAARAFETKRLWAEAAEVYQSGLELDKLAEDLYRGLMICHRELGEHTEVVQVYRRCREILSRMLGVQPNPNTLAIYRSVQQSLGLTQETGRSFQAVAARGAPELMEPSLQR